MDDKSALLERLRKLQRLADRGVGGEKETASHMLFQAMKHYGISADDLNQSAESEYRISVKARLERRLLVQIIAVVKNSPDVGYWDHSSICVTCTPAQIVEIRAMFGFYRGLLYKDVERLLRAFIHVNDLYPRYTSFDDHDGSSEDWDELSAAMKLADGMVAHTYYKQLG